MSTSDYLARVYRSEGGPVHEMNPTFLIEKILRERIVECAYWKEQCFGLNAASLVDRAVQIQCIGGQSSHQRPTEFICLVYKLLQLAPEDEIVLQYLNATEFKYLRAIAAFYIRLVWKDARVFETLEPLLNDYSKLRTLDMNGYGLTHMDEYVDALLNEQRVCDIALPPLMSRIQLEDLEELEPKESDDESEEEDDDEQKDQDESGRSTLNRETKPH
ncbi:U4/U6 X U5 tri-snRNP complex subunit Prp38 [Schizosaccharomyces japonicus yFS275]|uniref:Pre-mRNA-splicing factor 38 n=1 Tax=Schizosaccharomyces japonicus (strain yFS275 / FY16936) TaxID=402676 RepID=B6K0B4_SCHJY|nr:U4/U6 X U5 tri-snRNP complex subunit Prp38 [Schizosaccharomyces japonicus yFS275]EEB06264.1 U4/U6 X U5 tri-snRNP complex subunit Prp38 [Schizosaccharomyces japonicus yFS275]